MISLSPVINLLSKKPDGFTDIWFRRVDGVAEGEQIKTEAMPMPACWLMRESEKSQHAGDMTELVTITFNVVIGIASHRQHKKQNEADETLLCYRHAVKSLLVGYCWPDTHADPVNYTGGRLMSYSDGYMYWADTYTVRALVTNYMPDPIAGSAVKIERIIDDDNLL